jgi:hypothetical protein
MWLLCLTVGTETLPCAEDMFGLMGQWGCFGVTTEGGSFQRVRVMRIGA